MSLAAVAANVYANHLYPRVLCLGHHSNCFHMLIGSDSWWGELRAIHDEIPVLTLPIRRNERRGLPMPSAVHYHRDDVESLSPE